MMEAMFRSLQENEERLNERSASWNEIGKNYMSHVIEMQEDAEGMCLVAFDEGGEEMGFIFGYLDEADDSRIERYTGDSLYISDGYIKPEYRKRGIYRMLNTEIERIYLDKGIKRIYRFTLHNNENMNKFLKSEHYELTRVLFEKYF